MLITDITHIPDGQGWRYHFDSAAAKDMYLDGRLVEEAHEGDEYDLLTDDPEPPPIEACVHGARCTSAWASRHLTLQWFVDTHRTFAVEEYRDGDLHSVEIVVVPEPHRYHSVRRAMRSDADIAQTWMVRAAVEVAESQYAVTGPPVAVTMRRHYLPRPPVIEYDYDNDTRTLTIR